MLKESVELADFHEIRMAMRSVSQHSVTMLLWIAIVGGLTLMMGPHTRSESLFYYFRLEDQVPEDHLLRLVDKHIDFGFVHERLKDSYSKTGRPSINPELLLAHFADWLFVRGQQRAQACRGTAHAGPG